MRPREFWIYPATKVVTGEELISVKPLDEVPDIILENTMGIHVIEYSAYEEVINKYSATVDKYDKMVDLNLELREQNKIMREALETIANDKFGCGKFKLNFEGYCVFAKDTLEKCGDSEPTTKQEEK